MAAVLCDAFLNCAASRLLLSDAEDERARVLHSASVPRHLRRALSPGATWKGARVRFLPMLTTWGANTLFQCFGQAVIDIPFSRPIGHFSDQIGDSSKYYTTKLDEFEIKLNLLQIEINIFIVSIAQRLSMTVKMIFVQGKLRASGLIRTVSNLI